MSVLPVVAGTWILVALVPVFTRALGRRAGWLIAAGMVVAAGGLTISWSSDARTAVLPWIPEIGVALRLRLDGLSFVLALVAL
uniref:hypothetical protein n=1 Tax=Pseudactinotalea sp. TaxID=1926260 RepID=UPI003B3A9EDF